MAAFVDRVTVHVAAGNGGHGVPRSTARSSSRWAALTGATAATAGTSSSRSTRTCTRCWTSTTAAPEGRQRQAGRRALPERGRGEDRVLRVPPGTVVSTGGEAVADMVGAGTRFVIAHGGKGGLGNAALANARRKAPGFALLGEPGETFDAVLELKSIADVGLVGSPSAGKSSLIAAMSAARPKIADYPFTTLVPKLGVVRSGDTIYTMADVPGLIPGASTGKGLGLQFLRHVERCAVLVHVVDMATMEPGRDPESDIEALEHELREYGGDELDLVGRLRIAVLNKIDVPDARELVDLVRDDAGGAGAAGLPDQRGHPRGPGRARLRPGPRGGGVPREPAADRARPDHPRPAGGRRRRVHRRARPDAPTAGWCGAPGPSAGSGRPTSTTTRPSATWPTGSTGSGSRRRWPRPGPSPGDAITVGDVTFDWEPTLPAGTLTVEETAGLGGRGTDTRLENNTGSPPTSGSRRRRPAGCPTSWPRTAGSTATSSTARPRSDHAGRDRRRLPGGGQGGLLLAHDAARRAGRRPAARAGRRPRRPAGRGPRRSCWSPPARSRPDWRRWRSPAGRGTWPPRRQRPASGSCGWCRPTPTRSPSTGSPSGRCCSPPTT